MILILSDYFFLSVSKLTIYLPSYFIALDIGQGGMDQKFCLGILKQYTVKLVVSTEWANVQLQVKLISDIS